MLIRSADIKLLNAKPQPPKWSQIAEEIRREEERRRDEIKAQMEYFRSTHDGKCEYVRLNWGYVTLRDMAKELGISNQSVYNIGLRMGLPRKRRKPI